MKTHIVLLIASLAAAPELGQSFYKCPDPFPASVGSGISDEAKADEEAAKEERALAAEHHKARAAEEQAAAQRATAAAIRALGLRRW